MMEDSLFRYVADCMSEYASRIDKVDLFGLGEPLMDPQIFNRIIYLKNKGFKNLAISTNADLLDPIKQNRLLETGIETVIFSIDGTCKATHESIRRGVQFERVMAHCLSLIDTRDKSRYATRFVLRFIRLPENAAEWDAFKAFWLPRLSPARNDLLIAYNVNTMGGEVFKKDDILGSKRIPALEDKPCHQVFDRLIILNNGIVPLCCEDTPATRHIMGSVSDQSPMEIFNGPKFAAMRVLHQKGEKNRIDLCRECTLLYSESAIETHGTTT